MPKVTIEVPEGFEDSVKALEETLQRAQKGVVGAASGDLAAFDAAWQAVNAGMDETELQLKRRLLRGLDVDAPRVLIQGEHYARVGRYPATYKTRQGPVEVERSLYRQVGVRNGPTVDTLSVQAGCVAEGWLPEAAVPMAYLLARGTSREAEATAHQLGVLPYCRSSFERMGHEVGAGYGHQRSQVEAAMAEALEAPEGTRSVSVSVDRVAVPMEEPKKRPVGRPREDAPKRPVDVAWRMAYAACLTFHDAQGEALGAVRYGRMPQADARGLAERLARDVQALVSRQRALHVTALTDGAPELHALLDEALCAHAPAADSVVRLVDFWHLMEKLGAAALVVAGEAHASALAEKWKLSLLNTPGAVWTLVSALHASGKRNVVLGDRRPVHEALTYLENHGERMHYAEARARGLPIGSGNVEATCKSLVALRMKRPGARWKEASGQHILDLRALVLSDRWDAAIRLTLAPLRAEVRRVA
ncbi:ISKra4 family transposase [Corallococcus sp. AB030]|uniref:ISKra4 family transposase n=1 Tax=Corallococcus TaxID=83461 RepID=UPI000EE6F677|nr:MULTISPECIES: ISKra4 family transposase [Corallococcus]NRD51770.1 ISKra4 family transposase [Corallococcus exiguus]RKI19091.1 ISKra4 family transposase [Corallococcus sp. AB030]